VAVAIAIAFEVAVAVNPRFRCWGRGESA
jgi:hypothetical protein